MDDYKKEVHQRFAEKFARFIVENDNVAQTAYPMMVAFLDTALDNLLVEVEGQHKDHLNDYFYKNAIEKNITMGEDRYAKNRFKEALARFKGEEV